MEVHKNKYHLLKKWISGTIRKEEERQLEEAAVDDPFLADALEGYRQFPEGQHQSKLEQLQKRLEVNEPTRKPLLWGWQRIAAAGLLLLVAGVAFWQINRPESAGELAVEQPRQTEIQQEKPATETAPLDPERAPANEETTALVPPAEEKNAQENSTTPPPPPVTTTPKAAITEEPEVEEFADLDAGGAEEEPLSDIAIKEPALSPVAPSEIGGVSPNKESTAIETHSSRGLQRKTDQLATQPNVRGAETSPNAVGPLDVKSDVSIGSAIKQDSSLQARSGNLLVGDQTQVSPEGGYAQLITYLKAGLPNPIPSRERSKRKKRAVEKADITIQSVQFDFTVYADGSIGNIEVIPSQGSQQDSAVIRLLLNGPKWKITDPQQDSVRTTYRFTY